jgi:hypothetical protein
MNRIALITLAGVVAVSGSIALAQNGKDKNSSRPAATNAAAAPQTFELPPGMTEEDMMACIAAGTPGEMHAYLHEGVGEWHAQTTMWMMPGAEPMKSEGASKVSSMMDGRYIKVEMDGDMPGMGPFKGFGVYGYDNVAEQFQATWIDNHRTGIMTGKGALSSDRKTLTWTFTYNCPMTKKPATLREVETITGKDTKKMEMYGTDPASGKEFQMMEIAFTRRPTATATGTMR